MQLRTEANRSSVCRSRRGAAFRKPHHSRFPAHSPGIQWHRESSRTCFEGPFGEVIRATGPMSNPNPFRFSTKYHDVETDLIYYGYRYYNATTGSWVSRDPISEKGGVNIYSFVVNDPLRRWDSIGQFPNPKRGQPID